MEQAVHCIDMMQWAMGDETRSRLRVREENKSMMIPISMVTFSIILPVSTNGKMVLRGYHFSRQQNGTVGSYEVELYGTKGSSSAKNRHTIIAGDDSWRYRGENNDMYQTEHDELFASIRNANPFNDGEKSAHSTMVAF